MTVKTGLRYSQNPFIEDMIVPIRDQQVKLSRLGKDDNVLVNNITGEVQGTHVTTYRKVDADKFVFQSTRPGRSATAFLQRHEKSSELSSFPLDITQPQKN